MRGGGVGVCSRGGEELLLGFGNEALGEIVLTKLDVLGGLFGRGKGGYAQGAYLIE